MLDQTARKLMLALAMTFVMTVFAPFARADSFTYTYTGNLFSGFSGYTCTGVGECGIAGYFVLDAPLAASMNFSPAIPATYSYTDGVAEFDPTNSTAGLYMETDATGNITGWNVNFFGSGGARIESTGSVDVGLINSNDEAFVYNPGTWQVSEQVSAVPEPPSSLLLGSGILGLLGLAYRRRTSGVAV